MMNSESGTFEEIVNRRLLRREFLQTVGVGSALLLMTGCGTSDEKVARLPFPPIKPVKETDARASTVQVSETHQWTPLLKWGDPILADAPQFNLMNQSADAQRKQFGYNCDFVGFLPLDANKHQSTHGLLVVNHEYTNPELMFPKFDPEKGLTEEQVDVEMAAHGMSIVEIQQTEHRWGVNRRSKLNRRVTMMTPMQLTGPASVHPFLRSDPDDVEFRGRKGAWARGTMNNCSGGKTPWGTVLSGEENIQYYFGNLAKLNSIPLKRAHRRYGLTEGESSHGWEKYHLRFDVAQKPYEPFRFGWIVEVDPFDPKAPPRKRTALGRFRHEAATVHVTKKNEVVVYTGDDAMFEYVYKFVARNRFNPEDRKANFDLLDEGTLHVAKFDDDGTGEWLPLVYGSGPLTKKNGFTSQADVLIKTRLAADLLGATKMDRPEDIEVNVNGDQRVYIALTNNVERGTEGRPGTDKANPRSENKTGHLIALDELGNFTSTKFKWDIFLRCGLQEDATPISCPDNVTFDLSGNLWIATDGAPASIAYTDGLFGVPIVKEEAKARVLVSQFLSAPLGAEVCGPEFTPDNTSLFVAIQHPGEGSTFEKPDCHFPDGGKTVPRPTVIVVQAKNHKRVGT